MKYVELRSCHSECNDTETSDNTVQYILVQIHAVFNSRLSFLHPPVFINQQSRGTVFLHHHQPLTRSRPASHLSMPTNSNPEVALLEEKLKDIDSKRQRAHRRYFMAHETLHNSEDMIHAEERKPSRDRTFLIHFRTDRKIAAERMSDQRKVMDRLMAKRIKIRRQVSGRDYSLRTFWLTLDRS